MTFCDNYIARINKFSCFFRNFAQTLKRYRKEIIRSFTTVEVSRKTVSEQESYYAITICSFPESVPGHYLIELNDDLYYVYTLFTLGVNGSRDTVLVYKLNK